MMHFKQHKVCATLVPAEICIVVEQFQRGISNQIFHQHVPRHRISKLQLTNLLRVLVVQFSKLNSETVVLSFLNKRGSKPPRGTCLDFHVEYNEPGVKRSYCGGDIMAWSDEVVFAADFRETKVK